MIHRIVQFALHQRFLVLMLQRAIAVAGILVFQRMPVDAYPDLRLPWSRSSRNGPATPQRKSSGSLRFRLKSK